MILGVDLGQKTTGLAISEGQLGTPLKTIIHKSFNEALNSVLQTIELEGVDTIVVGFVEGKIKQIFENFAARLRASRPDLKVVLWDETLTSRQATESMVKLGIAKTKRRQKEHKVAAAIILQSYLDSNK